MFICIYVAYPFPGYEVSVAMSLQCLSVSLWLFFFAHNFYKINSFELQIVSSVRKRCPETPLVLYINGNGGILERMKGTGVDVIGLDWTVDMADGRRRLGSGISVQGNVDPAYLFSPLPTLTEEIQRLVIKRCLNFDLP